MGASSGSIPPWRSVVLVCLAALVVSVIARDTGINTATEGGVIPELPRVVGAYSGEEAEVSLSEKTLLPLDTVFAKRVYKSADGDEIACQIVLSGGQKKSIHRPEICLPGQGWTVERKQIVPIRLNTGKQMEVMLFDLSRPVQVGPSQTKLLHSKFLFWFVGKDKMTARHQDRVLITSMDRLLHNVNHRWAYVIVTSPVWSGFKPNGKDDQQTVAMLEQFIREVTPFILKPELLKPN